MNTLKINKVDNKITIDYNFFCVLFNKYNMNFKRVQKKLINRLVNEENLIEELYKEFIEGYRNKNLKNINKENLLEFTSDIFEYEFQIDMYSSLQTLIDILTWNDKNNLRRSSKYEVNKLIEILEDYFADTNISFCINDDTIIKIKNIDYEYVKFDVIIT